MQYSKEALKKVQETELEILAEVIRVCEENDIPYFSAGGTTLGAMRHDGFIPWDDDIDIGMLREDYERFLKIAPLKLKKGYTLQHFSTDKNTPFYFAKVRKDGTVFMEKYMRHIKMHHGIYIDIFPHDFVPDDLNEIKRQHWQFVFWDQLFIAKSLWTVYNVTNDKKCIIPNLIRSCLHILLLPVPRTFLFQKCEAVMQKYNGVFRKNVILWTPKLWFFHLDDIFPTQKHKFENMEICVPHECDNTLTAQYGDWRKLPPEDQRVNHQPSYLKYE